MDKTLASILELAVLAPSGDNCQPWAFEVSGHDIQLYNLPDNDTSLYNHGQKASFIAHGAVIENIRIAASAYGLTASVAPFPSTVPNLVASIQLRPLADGKTDQLFDYIKKRATNRRPYKSGQLDASQVQSLKDAAQSTPGTKIYLATEVAAKKALASQLAKNDKLVFENRHLHRFLFDHIRWTRQEVEECRDGLDLRAFELGAMDRFAFKWMKSWSTVSTLNKFGLLSKKIVKQAQQLCDSSAAIGMVTSAGNSDHDFLAGGMAMQRLWLEGARLGLAMHPMAGIALLINRLRCGATDDLSPDHIKTVKEVWTALEDCFHFGEETIVMLFRIGSAEAPSVTSLRYPLQKVIKAAD